MQEPGKTWKMTAAEYAKLSGLLTEVNAKATLKSLRDTAVSYSVPTGEDQPSYQPIPEIPEGPTPCIVYYRRKDC